MKYALLKMESEEKIVIVKYKHYTKYENKKDNNYYCLVGTIESDLRSSELLQGLSATEASRAEYYKHQLQQIMRFINI